LLLPGVTLKIDGEKSAKQAQREKLLEQQRNLENLEKQKAPELYREKQVDSLYASIYEIKTNPIPEEAAYLETNRYDQSRLSLKRYLKPEYKKVLKKKFMAGQSDKLIDNILD